MSHHPLREDKTCQNCRHVVSGRFCSNCGQENTETIQSFWYLFVHFIEDFTHYEGNFWKTLKKLILHPGEITNVYLSGKRVEYLPPVRLYIFVSFICFILINFFSANPEEKNRFNVPITYNDSLVITAKDTFKYKDLTREVVRGTITSTQADSIDKVYREIQNNDMNVSFNTNDFNEKYSSIRQLDSLRYVGETEDDYLHRIKEKMILYKSYTKKEIVDKASEQFSNYLPKILFIYLPVFAFLLWISFGRKKRVFFEFGIFSLHYFSAVLILIFGVVFTQYLDSLINNEYVNIVLFLISLALISWIVIYFYKGLNRVFKLSTFDLIFKATLLFFINCCFILIIFFFIFLYLLYNLI